MGGKWRTGILLSLLALGAAGCGPGIRETPEREAQMYTNPVTLEDEWGDYGLGDPFVFAYNGQYYLYVSTRDTDAGVKVWRSDNLTDWSYEGLCTEDPATLGAYAPEVRYWNGKFYMYTSPAGQGHYVLESDSPTGPFEVATGNFGRTIDGTTFVDDDGRWYFYYAGDKGIQAAGMTDPLTLKQEEVQTGAYMGGWTEGATVFKRGDRYYMTYTGNHVFSAGYRVDAAVSDSPLGTFGGFANNPLLLRTEGAEAGATVGVGHNSVVRGPDLDTQYMIYHNLEGRGIVGPLRHMNMDRIVWNGERFSVWGPLSAPQPKPALPDFAERFADKKALKEWESVGNGTWSASPDSGLAAKAGSGNSAAVLLLAKPQTEADYTAEFHVRVENGESAGAVFAYKDPDNYAVALLDRQAGEVRVENHRGGGIETAKSAPLPENLDIGQLQNVRLEVEGAEVVVYVQEMRLLQLELPSAAGGGRIGYAAVNADARFGYAAFGNEVHGSGVRKAYAPLPGEIDAVHYAQAENRRGAAVPALKPDGEGGYTLADLDTGAALGYRVNVAEDGRYNLSLRLSPGKNGAKSRLLDGRKEIAVFEAKASGGESGGWQTVSVHGVDLERGLHQWKLEITEGSMELDWIEAGLHTSPEPSSDDFEDGNVFGWTRYEGDWSVKDGQLRASSLQPGKILYGDYGWTDYSAEADLSVPEEGGQSGVLVRATEPANGLEQNQNRDDFLRGYSVFLRDGRIHLVKHDYNTQPLADVPYELPPAGEWVHMRVAVEGTVIAVYMQSEDEPVLTFDDRSEQPWLQGKAGFKTAGTAARFDDFAIEPTAAN
ncbi:family 43 glycosylhydrolase [Saccharibacillus sp. CPCC 101409]|uniref:family 43 glycosylhydrolase n=1 Tax=Saccharibacillus sp. CPCC 101409 TaxID=3058041 RepID=UPI002671094A|nr:family 43 glycosylhydrolase [Saccharibacillus sp. CPCC 101409]MDO3408438.1 family 43 glycosylhydrolase [Saccharibacillus sp. CPCC 101409]